MDERAVYVDRVGLAVLFWSCETEYCVAINPTRLDGLSPTLFAQQRQRTPFDMNQPQFLALPGKMLLGDEGASR